jgi:peptide-N4-(N-acetyl-beta-glucosaminyl)asparagine amidase
MDESLEMLLANPRDAALNNAVELLILCSGNILRDPDNMKYRRIQVAAVENLLIPVSGAIESLFNVGFEEDGEYFTLPKSVPLGKLKTLHDALTALPFRRVQPKPQFTVRSQYISPQSEVSFYNRLLGHVEQVRNYARPGVFEKARARMPLNELRKEADENFRHFGPAGGSVDEQLLLSLLAWFKESFFEWVDSPSCTACRGPTERRGHVPPTSDEIAYQAQRVESYKCTSSQCGAFTRFPRYNDPVRLLETRCGRCGEWANCFTLCCLAAGLEARLVVDWTDHVWTEVYSTSQQRWLHADACERACDKPLLYEAGWGKKLSYVIAFSPDDIQDVTWRYTGHPEEVLQRRTLCREGWLVHVITGLRQQVQAQRMIGGQLTAERQEQLTIRCLKELVELMNSNKNESMEVLGGRISGSVEWRRARGEIGSEKVDPVVISPTSQEASRKLLEIKYSCTKDTYVRETEEVAIVKGWPKLVFEMQDIFRKVENDWKMVYLARCEGKDVGSITWKFDLGSQGMCVSKLEIKVSDACFENGRVQWMLCSDDQCVSVDSGDSRIVEALNGCTEFHLTARLSGGKDQHAWQHAQLFRQKLDDTEFPLHIKIYMSRCS